MKNPSRSLFSFAMMLSLGTVALSAQSCAAVDHASQAVSLSVNASGEASGAVVASGASVAQAAGRVAAVPVWMSGAVVNGSGTVVSAIGRTSADAGAAAMKGAEQVWDSSTSDPAKRPALNRDLGLPPAPAPAATAKPKDPSPAEALKS